MVRSPGPCILRLRAWYRWKAFDEEGCTGLVSWHSDLQWESYWISKFLYELKNKKITFTYILDVATIQGHTSYYEFSKCKLSRPLKPSQSMELKIKIGCLFVYLDVTMRSPGPCVPQSRAWYCWKALHKEGWMALVLWHSNLQWESYWISKFFYE